MFSASGQVATCKSLFDSRRSGAGKTVSATDGGLRFRGEIHSHASLGVACCRRNISCKCIFYVSCYSKNNNKVGTDVASINQRCLRLRLVVRYQWTERQPVHKVAQERRIIWIASCICGLSGKYVERQPIKS